MLTHHLLYQTPLIQRCLTDLSLAILAQIFKLGLIRIAHVAEILEVDIDDEVLWDDLIFILSNVLGTQLHLTSLDVIASLDERRVKHDPEHHLVREPCMLEHNLNVTLQCH